MSSNERMAVAAHLHVALRRKAGRVTDTDWMAVNDSYAREIVRVARAKALEDSDAALAELADKLEAHIDAPAARKPPATPLLERLAPRAPQASAPSSATTPAAAAEGPPEAAGRYIGGLR
ncbi:hypothetical protein [Comamonas sp.]|uniref:hypothetical protein n=1 Tax=Comamonas sp. TaxID=34028 RepID=UPI0028994669|nr:hypothetical protein [Comamonas sp.]